MILAPSVTYVLFGVVLLMLFYPGRHVWVLAAHSVGQAESRSA